jgi:hypothetical protein
MSNSTSSSPSSSSSFPSSSSLRLSRLASLSDYSGVSSSQRFRVPTDELSTVPAYQPSISASYLISTAPAVSSPPTFSSTRFPLSPSSVSRSFGRPEFSKIQSSGEREIKIPYESRLGLRGSSAMPSQPPPTKLFTHESPILRDFFDHGKSFVSENGVNVAQCYYVNRRPLGGRLKTDIPSRYTAHGYRFFTTSLPEK